MSGAIAGGRPRLLRLGLAAGAASLGAVALSLLVGGSAASAADDGTDLLGGVVDTMTEPADAIVAELDATLAPVEPVAPVTQPVAALVGDAVEPLAAPVVSVLDSVVDSVVDSTLDAVLDPVLDPVLESVDEAVAALPVADGLLGEQPVTALVDPLVDRAADAAAPSLAPAAAGEEVLTGGALPEAPGPDVALDVGEASAPDTLEQRIAAALEGVTMPTPIAQSAATPASADASPPDRGAEETPAPGPPTALPSAASAGGSSLPAAITHDHLLLAPASGGAGAVEHDRIPASPVEELTASPD